MAVKKAVAAAKAKSVGKSANGAGAKTPPARTAAPKAAAVQTTITLKQIGVEIAAAQELPKQQIEAVFGDMIDRITKHLKKGSKVRISGIGILQVKKRAARKGRNPATGASIKVKASKTVSLRVGQDLKAKL